MTTIHTRTVTYLDRDASLAAYTEEQKASAREMVDVSASTCRPKGAPVGEVEFVQVADGVEARCAYRSEG